MAYLGNSARTKEVLAKYHMSAKKKFGQNFLIDDSILSGIVDAAGVTKDDCVLEIGPGLGMLTEALLETGCLLTSVELDHRLADYIAERFGTHPNFRLVRGDACRQDYDALMGAEPYRCIANLPYSCSTPFLSQICGTHNPPTDLCVLLQKEMADRLTAPHGTKEYGLPTVKLALRYRARILRMVPPGVFFPPPEVTSAFTKLELFDRCGDEQLRKCVEAIATAAFAQRRKKAASLMAPLFPEADIPRLLRQIGLPEDARADAISVPAYIALAKELLANSN